jgi:uncharacterized protein YkwD
MLRTALLMLVATIGLSACVDPGPMRPGADGKPVPVVYRISQADLPRIQFRILDSVNTLRARAGAQPLQLNQQLNAATATHSRDMSAQRRPWLFGSDGSSPVTRVRRAGYTGRLVGELISETFETELETLTAWMSEPDTRNVLMDPNARDMGFGFYQDQNGKLWWTLALGNPFEQMPAPQFVPAPPPAPIAMLPQLAPAAMVR